MGNEEMVMPGDGNMGGGSSVIPILDGGTEVVFDEVGSGIDKNNDPYAKIHLHYIDDDNAKAQIYLSLHRPDGLAKLVDIICLSGVAIKMKKNGSMKNDPRKGIPPSVLKSEKFHNQLNISLPGCKVLATITHRQKEFPDKETGEMVKYTESVIGKIAEWRNQGLKSTTLGHAPNVPSVEKTQVDVEKNDAQIDDDWS